MLPDSQLSSLDYVIEATLFAIHAASGILPQPILLTLIRTIPLNVLPDELPVIAEEYRRRHDERFHNYLEKTKRRMAEVDRLLSDHGLFADLLRSSEPPKK